MPRHFENFLTGLKEAHGEDTIVPDIFQTWAGISCIAGALGRRSWFDQGAFINYPNMYICLIGRPAIGKGVSFALPYFTLFDRLRVTIPKEIGQRPDTSNLLHYGTEKYPLYWIKDKITPEQMYGVMEKTRRPVLELSYGTKTFYESSVTLLTTEFGTLMRRDDTHLQVLLTELWDSKDTQEYQTKTQGTNVVRAPCLNWLSGGVLESFINNLPPDALEQGLLSRIIPVYYDGQRNNDQLFYSKPNPILLENLTEDLADIVKIQGQFTFHPDVVEAVKEDFATGIQPRPMHPVMETWLGRRNANLLKVAMALSAAKRSDRIIYGEDWTRAKQLIFQVEADMPHVLQNFGMGKAGKITQNAETYMKALIAEGTSVIPVRRLKRELLRYVSSAGEVQNLYDTMLQSGRIELVGDDAVKLVAFT